MAARATSIPFSRMTAGINRRDREAGQDQCVEAENVIEESERTKLSERDSLLVLDLLENPPPVNAKLRAAIAAMPKLA